MQSPSSFSSADQPQRVLIVDDDRAILQALRIRLTHEGFSVQAFADGTSALQHLDQFDPDVAVLDINMAGLDGIQVGARIQANNPDCRLLFLTASRDAALRERAEQLNVYAYMEKPYGSRDLVERIAASAASRAAG